MFDSAPFDSTVYDAAGPSAASTLVLVAALTAVPLDPDDDPFGIDPARTQVVVVEASSPWGELAAAFLATDTDPFGIDPARTQETT